MTGCSPRFRTQGLFVLVALGLSMAAAAQDVPVVQQLPPYAGFNLPNIGGTLSYSLTASENVLFGDTASNGFGSGTSSSTVLSGDVAYLSKSKKDPFSLIYSGGYIFGQSGYPSYTFQNLAVSQVANVGRWTFIAADNVSFLPQTPDAGFSGIPGLGDLTLQPVQVVGYPGVGILTDYGERVNNTISGTISRAITGKTSASVTGSYGFEKFTGDNALGISNSEANGSASVTHAVDARTSYGGVYTYGHSAFSLNGPAGQYGYDSQTFEGNFQRQLTHRVGLQVSAGPQITYSTGGRLLSGTSTNVAANAGLSYAGRVYNDSLTYSRGVNNGNGVVVGSQQDVVTLSAARRVGRITALSTYVGYNRSVSLPNLNLPGYTSNGVVAGGQASVQLSRVISAYASYTVQRQAFSGNALAGNAYNGLIQNLGFGVTYSPRPLISPR